METTTWFEPFIRQFPDRALRSLMRAPDLFVQFLDLLDPALGVHLEPETLVLVEPSFIDEAYRERLGDVLYVGRLSIDDLEIPVRISFDHQSTGDPWMPHRILHFMTSIWERERRDREAARREAGLTPVVPCLLYTGPIPWAEPFALDDLFRAPALASFTPKGRLLFLDLARVPVRVLEDSRHPLAWAFRVLREEKAPFAVFLEALAWAAGRLNRIPEARIEEWRSLVRFLFALTYHRRREDEHPRLFAAIRTRLRPRKRAEVNEMEKTLGRTLPERVREETLEEARLLADRVREEALEEARLLAERVREETLEEARLLAERVREETHEEVRLLVERAREEGLAEGRARAKKETLLRLATAKFGSVPDEFLGAIERCEHEAQLDVWLERLRVARTPTELGIDG